MFVGEIIDFGMGIGDGMRVEERGSLCLCAHQRSNLFAFDDPADIAQVFEIKDQDRDIAFFAHGQGGHVHDAEFFFDGFVEGEVGIAGGVGVFVGIGGVDPVDLGGFEEDIAIELGGAEGRAGVGGAEWVARARCEDHDASFVEVADGPVADEGFGDCSDIECREDTGIDADGVEFFFEGRRVHDGAEHAHIVGGRLVDIARFGEFGPSDDIAPADDDGDLGPGFGRIEDLVGDDAQFFGVDPESVRGAEGLAAELEQDALGRGAFGGLDGIGHGLSRG